MLLVGKKVVVVGGSSGIVFNRPPNWQRVKALDVVIASCNAEGLKAAADKLGAKAILTGVTNDESVAQLFKTCGLVDHVVVTAAQLRPGPFKTVSMEEVRVTMEGEFWGSWRVARALPKSARAVRLPLSRAS